MLRLATPSSATVIRGVSAWRWFASFFRDQVGTLTALHGAHGPAVALREWIPLRRHQRWCLLVCGTEYNRQVLTNTETFHSGGLTIRGPRGSALNGLRRGLVGMNGDQHRAHRRVVNPLFSPRAIRQYYPKMVSVVQRLLESWPQDQVVDVSREVSRTALHISSQNLLGSEDPAEALRLGELTEQLLKRSFSSGVWMLPLDLPGTPYRKLLRLAERIHREYGDVIQRRQHQSSRAPDMYDRLIRAQRGSCRGLPLAELVDQAAVLFSASHETVAKAVTWTLFLLSQHPRIMDDLYQELRNCLGDEPPSLDDLEQLTLLDAVTKEAMRLFPPVPWAARRVQRETELAGIPVGRKDYVVLSHFVTHRAPDIFPHPLQFRPERWFETSPDSYAYLPFSAGPRTCIGKALGSVTIQLMVAMILQRFRLTLVPRSRIDRTVHVTLAPKFGMPMAVRPQDGRFQASPVRGNVHEMVDLTRSDAMCRPATFVFPAASHSEIRKAA